MKGQGGKKDSRTSGKGVFPGSRGSRMESLAEFLRDPSRAWRIALPLLIISIAILFIGTTRGNVPWVRHPEGWEYSDGIGPFEGRRGNIPLTAKENDSFQISVERLEIPDEMMVYTVEPRAVTEEEISGFAERMGASGELDFHPGNQGDRGKESFTSENDDCYFRYYINSGEYEIRYKSETDWRTDAIEREELFKLELPPDERCREIAGDYMEKRGIEIPWEEWSVKSSESTSSLYKGQWESVDLDKNISVRSLPSGLDRECLFDENRCAGPRPPSLFMELWMGEDIRYVMGSYTEMKPFGSFKMKKCEQALKDLRAGQGYVIESACSGREPQIAGVELIYYLGPTRESPRFLQPAYNFHGPCAYGYVQAISQ